MPMNLKLKKEKKYTATKKRSLKGEKDGDLPKIQRKMDYQLHRFIKAATFTGIPLFDNQSCLVLVC